MGGLVYMGLWHGLGPVINSTVGITVASRVRFLLSNFLVFGGQERLVLSRARGRGYVSEDYKFGWMGGHDITWEYYGMGYYALALV